MFLSRVWVCLCSVSTGWWRDASKVEPPGRGLAALAVVAPAVLAGCGTVEPYPVDWAPMVARSAQKCPDLRGMYRNGGVESGSIYRSCSARKGTGHKFPGGICGSLTYNLLGFVWAGWGHGDSFDTAMLGFATTIEQPSDDRLVVVSDHAMGEHNSTGVVLSASNGDFSCGPDGLTLRAQTGVSSYMSVGTERRTFKTTADGSLVMRVQAGQHGLLYVVPFTINEESWVKWARIAQEPTTQGLAKP